MIKRLTPFYFLMAVLVLFSCTNEETLDADPGTAELATDLSTYANTPFGKYKGVFTTNDSQERGVIEINVIDDLKAKAILTLNSGEIIYYSGEIIANNLNTENRFTNSNGLSIAFKTLAGTDNFQFNVKPDGSSPSIRTAVYNDKPSFISVLKENTRNALITNTGTYTGSGFDETFSIVFDSQADADGNTAGFTTQILVNMNDIGTDTGNFQTNCNDDMTNRFCDISGVASAASGITLDWSGLHFSTIGPDCSQIDGTWTATGAGGGNFSGTFVSDTRCGSCNGSAVGTTGGLVSAEAGDNSITDNATFTFTADVMETGTIGVDAALDNVALDITHTFDGDLTIDLISPAGTTINLSNEIGGAGDDYTGTVFTDTATDNITSGAPPYTGSFNAEGGSFNAAFDGETVTGTWILSISDGAGGDQGTLNSWAIAFCDEPFTLPPPPPPPVGCNGTALPVTGSLASAELGTNDITDNATHSFTATSAGMGIIGIDADIDNVALDITHTFDGDLDITLISPAGTTLDLTSGNGGAGDDYTATVFRDGGADITAGAAPFTGDFQPEGGSFSIFNGESITGDWILSIDDTAGGDQGTLNSWSINFCDENIISGFGPETTGGVTSRIHTVAIPNKVYKDKSKYKK